ncbi:response regulator [bacterium]|nr:response regulator [bacterium]
MSKIGFLEFRKRFEPKLAGDLLKICVSKELILNGIFIDKEFSTSIKSFDLDAETPFMVLHALTPREGNQLAKKQKEILFKFDFMYKGLLYHARFKTILYDLHEDKNRIQTVFATPPLDVKLATEIFKGHPSPTNPMRVKIDLFNKEQLLSVKNIDIKSALFEDRLISDSLPALSKVNELSLVFSKHDEIIIPGKFISGDENQVNFIFGKLSPDSKRFLSAYLEKLYHADLLTKAEKEKEGAAKAKRPTASDYKILILTKDEVYIKELDTQLQGRNVRFVQEKEIEDFSDILARQNWDMILIDGTFPEIDLWALSRKMNEILAHRGSNMPHYLLLSEEMKEDSLVYAQYCGFEHIYGRESFLARSVSNIGEVSGHHEWVSIHAGEKAVVIIDDDKNVTFTLQHALTREGFHPFVIRSGKDAVRAAKQFRPICILIELALRSGDALDALRVIKRMPYTKDIPIIVLTVSKDPADVKAMRQLGVQHYLNKPINTTDIIDVIKSIKINNGG